MSVLTKFGKGIKNSAALSFNLSASKACSDLCKLKGQGCYAENIDRLYKSYGNKLRKHQRTKPYNLVYAAIQELKERKVPVSWFRLSVSGSLPARKDLSSGDFRKLKSSLENLAKYLKSIGADLHVPVETEGKARTYRAILEPFGFTVRRTAQTHSFKKAKDQCAYVVMKSENAQEIAKQSRINGKSVVICPAIVAQNKEGRKNQCGRCLACSSDKVDLVLYPLHN